MRNNVSVLVWSSLFVAGCSGGGNTPTPTPTPTPSLAVTLSPVSQTAEATEDNSEATFTFDAQRTGSASGVIVADVQFDRDVLSLRTPIAESGGKYTVRLASNRDLGGGTWTGKVTFRLCQEVACANVYPNTTQEFTYTLNVPLKNWETQQRNASHNGYVHATLNSSLFKKAWEWTPAYTERISAASTRGGNLFVTRFDTDGTVGLHALSTRDGSPQWSYSFGRVHWGASAPSVGGQQVYVSTMVSSSGNNPTYVIDASTGQYLRRLDTAAQWSNFAPPTAFGDGIYIASGYYGGEVYDFNASTGVLRWNKYGGSTSIWDGQTPAVDEGNVYYYSGLTIDVFDRTTGKILKSIPNPHFTWGGYSYVGGPILGSNDNVIVFPSSFTLWAEQQPPSPLANFSLTSEKATWKSQNVYSTVPALAKGVVYVARNAPARLDALSEETGQILWSWTPPTSSESFIGNLIATDNLVFVSSNTRLYAISVSDPAHPSVWQADTPGFISIASDFTLLVAVRGASPTNRLVAYNLR